MENFGRDVRKCQIECLCNTMNKYALSHVKVLNFNAWKERAFFCKNEQAFVGRVKCAIQKSPYIWSFSCRGKARNQKVPDIILNEFQNQIWNFDFEFVLIDFFYFDLNVPLLFQIENRKRVFHFAHIKICIIM